MRLKALLINDQDEEKVRRGRIGEAAWRLEDALANRLAPAYPKYPVSVLARGLHFEAASAEKLGTLAMQCLVLLSIFETPNWCDTTSSGFDFSMTAEERCNIEGTPNDNNLFLSSVPYLPPGIGALAEMACLIIVSHQYWLKWKLQTTFFDDLPESSEHDDGEHAHGEHGHASQTKGEYHDTTMIKFGLVMVFFGLLDCVAFLGWRSRYRLSFLTRSGILATIPCFKDIMECVIAVIPDFRSGLSFFLGAIGFFTWISVTIFDDIPDDEKVYGERVNDGLNSMSATLNTMFIAGATDEFVDCFIKSYSMYRVCGILWLLFLIIVQVLLKNLMLDTLVAAYMRHSEEQEEKMLHDQVKGIGEAFQSLCEATDTKLHVRHSCGQDKEEQVVEECHFLDFVQDFSSSPNTKTVDRDTAQLMFKAIDKDGSHSVDQTEFAVLCGILNYEIWVTEVDSPVADMFPSIWNCFLFRRLRTWVTDGNEGEEVLSSFDTLMNSVLIANLVLVLLETKQNMENGGNEAPWLEQMELIFSFVYVMECGVKLCIYSFAEYWSDRSNQFDFFTTWLLLGSSILDELSTEDQSFASLKRYVNILRLLRLLRVLKQLKRLKRVQFMVKTCIRLVAASKSMVTSLSIVIFFFTSLSVQLWGGLLYKNNPALKGTEYDEAHYHVLNYNDFLSAVGAWVLSLMCEYVPKFTDAVVAATGQTVVAYTVFLSFYFFTVSVMFELVKAFTIEVFITLNQQDKEEQEQQAKEQAGKKEKRADGCFAWLFGSKIVKDQEEKAEVRLERKREEREEGNALSAALKRVSDTVEKKGRRLHFRAIGDEGGVEKLIKNFDKIIKEAFEHSVSVQEELWSARERKSGEVDIEHERTDVARSHH